MASLNASNIGTQREYRQCFYIELHCSVHGDIRAAVLTKPANQHPCPVCGNACASAALGQGLTKRHLPAFELVVVGDGLRAS